MKILKDAIDKVLPTAIQRSALATAIMAEGNGFPAADNRPDEVKTFEAELRAAGANKATALVASKLMQHPINVSDVAYGNIKPTYLGVLVGVKPYGSTRDEVLTGLPWGTPIINVRSKSSLRAGGSNWRSGSKLFSHVNLSAGLFRPATEEEVKAAVEALFAARPAGTLKLYGIKFDNGVQSIASSGEEDGDDE